MQHVKEGIIQKKPRTTNGVKCPTNKIRTDYCKFMRSVWRKLPTHSLVNGNDKSYCSIDEQTNNLVNHQEVVLLVAKVIHNCLFDGKNMLQFAQFPDIKVELLTVGGILKIVLFIHNSVVH